MQSEIFRRLKAVPTIVRIIITQATRRHAEGGITQPVFDEQIRRICREELEPRGLTLLVRELPAGSMRFLIKERSTGAICDMMDFDSDGAPQYDQTEATAG